MPNTCFDSTDLIVPAFDYQAKSVQLTVQIHPGQVRMMEYILNCGRFPFHDNTQVRRWAVCWAIYTLLAPLPSTFGVIEARMNILQDENFERQKDCLEVSVQKFLANRNSDAARTLIMHSHEEYRKIPNEYWRNKWLSTLDRAVEMLGQQGIHLKIGELAPTQNK